MQMLNQTLNVKFITKMFFTMTLAVLMFSCTKEKVATTNAGKTNLSSNIPANASDRSGSTAIPYVSTIYVPCANGGAGEYVRVMGTTNLNYTISWTAHGFTYGYHANTYQIEGVGLTTGDRYQGSGQTEGQVLGAWVNEQWLSIFLDHIRLRSATNSFVITNAYRVLVNPDGDVEVSTGDRSVDCN